MLPVNKLNEVVELYQQIFGPLSAEVYEEACTKLVLKEMIEDWVDKETTRNEWTKWTKDEIEFIEGMTEWYESL